MKMKVTAVVNVGDADADALIKLLMDVAENVSMERVGAAQHRRSSGHRRPGMSLAFTGKKPDKLAEGKPQRPFTRGEATEHYKALGFAGLSSAISLLIKDGYLKEAA